MQIKLSGYNVDANLLKLNSIATDALTPETLSAAYARISRDPRPINELRDDAIDDVVKARATNENIVFGLGHASVAEHAVFNFDIMGVSRLAIEAIEHARLCSYTEKSQRYIKLQDDYVVPTEIVEIGLEEEFRELIKEQNATYQILLDGISNHLTDKNPNATKEELKLIKEKAKEDARYVTSLSVEGQLGMTCNARNLEYMIKRLLSNQLAEIREIGNALYNEVKDVAPSLIKYVKSEQLYLYVPKILMEPQEAHQNLLSCSGSEDMVMATLLHSNTNLDMAHSDNIWRQTSTHQRKCFLRTIFEPLQPWDAMPREFELLDFTFELAISASCFAQLKRHRMATLLPQAYNPSLGYTIPQTVKEAGLEDLFMKIMSDSEKLYYTLLCRPFVAPYVLTQAHRRRVVVKMNARELYHFARLRLDRHAQWDIREIANQMISMAKERCPMVMALACGKDVFQQQKEELLEKLADSEV